MRLASLSASLTGLLTLLCAMETGFGESGKLGLTELDGTNYPAWKFKIKTALKRKGLWDFVQGTEAKASKYIKALALIGKLVNDSQIVYIQECITGINAWGNLSALYENSGVADKMHLMEELMTANMNSEQEDHSHVVKIRSVVGKLGTIGAEYLTTNII